MKPPAFQFGSAGWTSLFVLVQRTCRASVPDGGTVNCVLHWRKLYVPSSRPKATFCQLRPPSLECNTQRKSDRHDHRLCALPQSVRRDELRQKLHKGNPGSACRGGPHRRCPRATAQSSLGRTARRRCCVREPIEAGKDTGQQECPPKQLTQAPKWPRGPVAVVVLSPLGGELLTD